MLINLLYLPAYHIEEDHNVNGNWIFTVCVNVDQQYFSYFSFVVVYFYVIVWLGYVCNNSIYFIVIK